MLTQLPKAAGVLVGILLLSSCQSGGTPSATRSPAPPSTPSVASATKSAAVVQPSATALPASQSPIDPAGPEIDLTGHLCSLITPSEIASIIGGPVEAGKMAKDGCNFQGLNIVVGIIATSRPQPGGAKIAFESDNLPIAPENLMGGPAPVRFSGLGDEANYNNILTYLAQVSWYRGNYVARVEEFVEHKQRPASKEQTIALAKMVDGHL